METLKPVDIARRRLLLGVSAAAATQLAACATCKREEFPATSTLAPLTALAGSVGPKAKAGGVFIDAHAHFFNASDVQVEGFVAGPLAHSLKDARLAELARKLAPIVARLADLAPSPAEEMGLLQELTGRLGAMSTEAATDAMDKGLQERRELRLQKLQEALNRDPEVLLLFQQIMTRALQTPVDGISLTYLRDAAYLGSGFDFAKQRSIEMRGAMRGSKAEVEAALGMAGIFRFVVLMLSPRVDNVRLVHQGVLGRLAGGSPGGRSWRSCGVQPLAWATLQRQSHARPGETARAAGSNLRWLCIAGRWLQPGHRR